MVLIDNWMGRDMLFHQENHHGRNLGGWGGECIRSRVNGKGCSMKYNTMQCNGPRLWNWNWNWN
jgi:hypothetical protein